MHRYSCVIIINMLFILYVRKDPVVQNSFFCMQCNSTVLRVTFNIFPDGDYILLTLLLLSKQLVLFFFLPSLGFVGDRVPKETY